MKRKSKTRKARLATNILDRGNVINPNPNQWILPETKAYLKADENKSDTENELQGEGKFIVKII